MNENNEDLVEEDFLNANINIPSIISQLGARPNYSSVNQPTSALSTVLDPHVGAFTDTGVVSMIPTSSSSSMLGTTVFIVQTAGSGILSGAVGGSLTIRGFEGQMPLKRGKM